MILHILVTAVKEIEYVKSFHDLIDSNFKYYVMGFYIDNCQKMKYKGEYHPTEILDIFTLNFVNLDDVKNVIKDNKCHKLSNEKTREDFIQFNNDEIENIVKNMNIKFRGKMVNVNLFIDRCIIEKYRDMIRNDLKRFISLIGKKIYNCCEFVADFD